MSEGLQELLDRQAIYDVMMRYCRGVDRFDADLITSAYHPDARDDHTVRGLARKDRTDPSYAVLGS